MLEIVIEEVLWSIRGSYQTIWSSPLTNVKWHSVTWPHTMTTPYWSDFVPNSIFYRILSGFHRTGATGVACRQGTLTPPDTSSRPFGTCICSACWDQSFSRSCRYFTGLSLGAFSILLLCNLFRSSFDDGQQVAWGFQQTVNISPSLHSARYMQKWFLCTFYLADPFTLLHLFKISIYIF